MTLQSISLPYAMIFALDDLCGAIGPARALEALLPLVNCHPSNPDVARLAKILDGKDPLTAMTDARALIGIKEPA